MTPRLLILIPILGGMLALASVQALADMAGKWGAFFGVLACVGSGLVVAFLVGWPEVRATEGDGQP